MSLAARSGLPLLGLAALPALAVLPVPLALAVPRALGSADRLALDDDADGRRVNGRVVAAKGDISAPLPAEYPKAVFASAASGSVM
ncbi:MAG: hypothetical protein ACREEE_15290 [Dongiaceae bacterium]